MRAFLILSSFRFNSFQIDRLRTAAVYGSVWYAVVVVVVCSVNVFVVHVSRRFVGMLCLYVGEDCLPSAPFSNYEMDTSSLPVKGSAAGQGRT